MNLVKTEIPDVMILQPNVFADERGFFFEPYNKRTFQEATGLDIDFVQDNHSRSQMGVLRGLHYQIRHPQGKLVRVAEGEVWDVAVDLRRSSPTFGRSVSFRLDAISKRMAWIPPGFAHGFLVLSAYADFLYKTTDYYDREHERAIRWNDPQLGLTWPFSGQPIVSTRDARAPLLAEAELYP